ncbi:MAG: hypothetical protein NVSMB9_09440 [Isosphaeraceae bacterium]
MRARRSLSLSLFLLLVVFRSRTQAEPPRPLPETAKNWRIELVAQAPEILFPTALVAAPDGTLYLGQDPMDMPGPPTEPIDSVLALKDGKSRIFAEKLWAVMGLEWLDGTLYVVHAPYLSAFRDTNGDGKADQRVDLITGLGPKLPGFNGLNDHVASGIRLGMDGYLYISIGDKGIPRGVGRDGTVIQLRGGGVIRIRPDGTGLEIVSTGERNPLSVALGATDEIFTYGNDDDSKKWPNSLTHHIVGGHYGYPFEFLTAPDRALPVMGGDLGGSGAQGLCYNEDGLPEAYRGNLFFCDWGLQTVFRYTIERKGGTFALKSRTPFVTQGDLDDFRPFSLGVSHDGASLFLVDWGFNSWLTSGVRTGRLYRLWYDGPDQVVATPRPRGDSAEVRLRALDHPALAVRLESQRRLSKLGPSQVAPLQNRLRQARPETGRLHALWALDAIGDAGARKSIREVLADPLAEIRLQAARCAGIRHDRGAVSALIPLLKDSAASVRREAAIALGKIKDPVAAPPLLDVLGDPDPFAAWSVRQALRAIGVWNVEALTTALLDPARRDNALKLCDENWAAPIVEALSQAVPRIRSPQARARTMTTIAGLYRKYPAWSGEWFGTNPLAGQFPRKTEAWDPLLMSRVQEALTLALKDNDPTVRLHSIAGLIVVGRPALPSLRGAILVEKETRNLVALAQGLGVLGDFVAATPLGARALDAARPDPVRAAALDALGKLRGPQALTARISLVYDSKAPPALVARALPALGREKIIPPNDLVGFLENPDPSVRATALISLGSRDRVSAEIDRAILDRLDDRAQPVQAAAMKAAVSLNLREAVPRLLRVALNPDTRPAAMEALAALPDPRAIPLYLAALRDRGPEVRKAGENALSKIRDAAASELESAARSGRFEGEAALALERVLTRFKPVLDWKVIGPFPRTTARIFLGDPSIDFARSQTGAEGRTIAWASRRAEPETGRVVIDDFKGGAGDRGGFGYDQNGSPDLSAFAYAEVLSDQDREALILLGSSGSLKVTVNERMAHSIDLLSGRAYQPDTDLIRVPLKKGKNRLLLLTRQGIGAWSFSAQLSEPLPFAIVQGRKAPTLEERRAFALQHAGDPRVGETIFFDAKGIGCVKCHSIGQKGTSRIGPDLTGLALKYDRAEIIRSVLEPSNRIANGYNPVVLATHDGKVVTGLVRSETAVDIEVIDSETKVTRIPKETIEERKVGNVSVMPMGQVESLSLVEFADLISYLQSLKAAPPAPAVR